MKSLWSIQGLCLSDAFQRLAQNMLQNQAASTSLSSSWARLAIETLTSLYKEIKDGLQVIEKLAARDRRTSARRQAPWGSFFSFVQLEVPDDEHIPFRDSKFEPLWIGSSVCWHVVSEAHAFALGSFERKLSHGPSGQKPRNAKKLCLFAHFCCKKVTLTPSEDAVEQSLTTLRFAQKAAVVFCHVLWQKSGPIQAAEVRCVAKPVLISKERTKTTGKNQGVDMAWHGMTWHDMAHDPRSNLWLWSSGRLSTNCTVRWEHQAFAAEADFFWQGGKP